MGGQRGSWLQKGGVFCPSDAFLPIPKASLLPAPSHQHIGRVLRCGCVAGCGGDGTPLSPRGRLHLNHTLQLRHSHYLLSHDTYI